MDFSLLPAASDFLGKPAWPLLESAGREMDSWQKTNYALENHLRCSEKAYRSVFQNRRQGSTDPNPPVTNDSIPFQHPSFLVYIPAL